MSELGICVFCDEECGPNSTICIACVMNPKRRRRYAEERNAALHTDEQPR